jgi:hypothetical protein
MIVVLPADRIAVNMTAGFFSGIFICNYSLLLNLAIPFLMLKIAAPGFYLLIPGGWH